MTKSDYEKLATALQRASVLCETDNQRRGVERSCLTIADMLELDNRKFDRRRFFAACKVGANVRARHPLPNDLRTNADIDGRR